MIKREAEKLEDRVQSQHGFRDLYLWGPQTLSPVPPRLAVRDGELIFALSKFLTTDVATIKSF